MDCVIRGRDMNFNFNLAALLKFPGLIIYVVFITSTIILSLPDEVIQKIKLFDLRQHYGMELGIALIVSFSLGTGLIIKSIYKKMHALYIRWRFYGKNKLLRLSTYEKAIIYIMYKKDNHTVDLKVYDGAVVHLKSESIIKSMSGAIAMPMSSICDPLIPHFLQPWVVRLIQENYKVYTSLEKSYEEKQCTIASVLGE